MNGRNETLRLLLLDASNPQREATKRLLDPTSFQIVAEGSPNPDAVSIARELMPDVILVGVDESSADILRTIELLTVAVPDAPILALSSSADPKQLHHMVAAGARGFLAMPFNEAELTASLQELAEQQRRRVELGEVLSQREQPGDVVAVFGAKGGVGRTMVATNLGVALAARHDGSGPDGRLRVALVDLDLDFGDVALELDLAPERSIADLGATLSRLDPELLLGFLTRHSSGLYVLAAPSRPDSRQAITPAGLHTMFSLLARTHDVVLVDLPRELNENVAAVLELADRVLLLVSNQMASLKNARLTLGLMRDWGLPEDKVRVVLNEAHHTTGVPLEEARAGLGVPAFWVIPHDCKPVGLAQWGWSFMLRQPRSRIAESIAGLSRVLLADLAKPLAQQAKGARQP